MTKPITAYAALLIDGQPVGERHKCRLWWADGRLLVDRCLTFDPAARDGVATVCFFRAPEGPERWLEVALFRGLITGVPARDTPATKTQQLDLVEWIKAREERDACPESA